jgi:hypothetical protein
VVLPLNRRVGRFCASYSVPIVIPRASVAETTFPLSS